MKLERKDMGQSKFFKFATIGDTIVGRFVEFQKDVPGKFGPETSVILETEHGPVSVKCTNDLEAKLEQNIDALEGQTLTIRYVADKPIGKASPMKVYEVDATTEAPF